jgi:Response regulator receiver domain
LAVYSIEQLMVAKTHFYQATSCGGSISRVSSSSVLPKTGATPPVLISGTRCRLAETGQRIPILFLSARASEEEERHALQAGAAGFLRKPVRKEALLSAIHSILETPTTNKD